MSVPISMWWPVSNNFGDLIGPYVAAKITGRQVMYAEAKAEYPHYVVGGSVLNHVSGSAVVWGAGLGTITDGVNTCTDIRAVRGPFSRARALACGAQCPPVYGDPGMLLPRFHTPSLKRDRKIGIVPHYVDQYRAYDRYRELHVIDVFQPIGSVIDEICSCEAIYSSSLHGIIVAHAYGIPATWIKISDSMGGDGTKFRDYFGSVGMDVPQPVDLREHTGLPPAPTFVPKINTDDFMRACPLPV